MKSELSEIFAHPAVAAALGAIVGLRAIPGTSYTEKAINVALSFAIASYGGPVLIEYMQVTSVKLAAGMIFAVGATGLVVFNGLIEAVKRTDLFGKLAEAVASWFPRKGGQ